MPARAPRSWSVARWTAVALVVAASSRIALADGPRGAEWASKDAIIYVEATHPQILLDRLTDPKMQGRLAAIPQYEKAIKGEQFKQLTAGVYVRLGDAGDDVGRGPPQARRGRG